MNQAWRTVELGEVLARSRTEATIDSKNDYKEVTVRLWGKGVNLRGVKSGAEFGDGKRYFVTPGQFIVSKIDARHGAFGVIPEELNNAVVTSDFPVFSVVPDQLNVKYLDWLSKTPAFVNACKKASEGTTNRVRLKEARFSNIKIELPDLSVQEKIVNEVESLYTKFNEARVLRNEVLLQAQAMLHSVFHEIMKESPYRTMADVCPLARRPVIVEPDVDYAELGVRSFGKGTFHKPELNGLDVGSKKLYYIEPDDLVLSNVFAWEGAIAVAKPEDKGRVGSHRFITCVPKEGIVTSDFLRFYLLSREGLEKIQEASPGGAGRNRTLGLKKLEKIEVPVPDYEMQIWFNQLQGQVHKIQQAQADNEIELIALMPSILDKAFKGKLI